MNICSHFLSSMISVSIMTKFVVGSIITGEKLNKESIAEFIDGIKSIEEYTKNAHRQKFAMLRIINREMSISDMISLYQRLFGDIENEETLTFITITHNENDQVHSPDDYYKNFVYELQERVRNNEKYITISKNLSISIKCIEKIHINDFSCVNETTEQLLNLTNDFSIFMITSMFDICYAFLKYTITMHMRWFLHSSIESEPDLIHTYDKKSHEPSRNCLEYIVKTVGDSARDETIYEAAIGVAYFHDLYFDEFCIRFHIKTNRKYDKYYMRKYNFLFITWQYVLLNKHKKEFSDYLVHMSRQFMPTFASKCCFKPFYTLFAASIDDMYKDCTFLSDENTSFDMKLKLLWSYIVKISNCKTFKDRCNLFFVELGFQNSKEEIEETHMTRNEKMCREYRARKSIKIILNGKINNAKCSSLLRILKNTNLFDRLNNQEVILFVDGKRVKRKALLAGASIYSSKKITFDTGEEYKVFDCETLEIFTTRRQKNNTDIVANHFVSWSSSEPLECLTSRLDADQCSFVPITTITAGKYNECNEISNAFLDKFTSATNSMLENVYCIILTNVCEEVNIYCIHSKVRDTECEMISLLYKINSKGSTKLIPNVHSTNDTTKWVYNVTKSMLDNLASNIRCYLTATNANFIIPNIVRLNDINFVYDVSDTRHRNYDNRYDELRKNLTTEFAPTCCKVKHASLCIRKFLNYDPNNSYPLSDDIFETISKKLGFEKKQLYDIISRFLLDMLARECMDKNCKSERLHDYYDIELYALHHKDGCITLQIWELITNRNLTSFLQSLPIIYQSLSTNKKIAPIISLFKQIEDCIGLEKSIACTLIRNICTKLNFREVFGFKCDFNFDSKRYSEGIHSDIEKTIMDIDFHDSSAATVKPNRLLLLTLQNSISLEDMTEFVELVLDELRKKFNLYTLRVTLVRIKDVYDHDSLNHFQS